MSPDIISEGVWYDHLTDTDGHTTSRGRVYGVTPYHYTDCVRYGCKPVTVIDPAEITGPDETGEDGDPRAEIGNCLRRLAETDPASTYRRKVAERLAEVFDPTPPRPEEPQGLGAVVEDEDGSLLVRIALTSDRPWVTMHGTAFSWREIDLARVIDAGWSE